MKSLTSKKNNAKKSSSPLIHVFNRQKAHKILKSRVKKIVEQVLLLEKETCDEVSVHFVSTKEICDLHLKFFNDGSKTDCISLPIDDSFEIHYRVLGEIFVCPETALEYASLKKIDSKHEVILYIVHGLLHLLGYDDMNPKDKRIMRAAEKKHMKNLADLYLT